MLIADPHFMHRQWLIKRRSRSLRNNDAALLKCEMWNLWFRPQIPVLQLTMLKWLSFSLTVPVHALPIIFHRIRLLSWISISTSTAALKPPIVGNVIAFDDSNAKGINLHRRHIALLLISNALCLRSHDPVFLDRSRYPNVYMLSPRLLHGAKATSLGIGSPPSQESPSPRSSRFSFSSQPLLDLSYIIVSLIEVLAEI